MGKEYFSHDYNARNDKKIAALVKDYKSSGYGIFWATCEMLHEEKNYLEFDDLVIGVIAKDLNEDEYLVKEVIEKCVEKYKLFSKKSKQNEALLEANEAKRSSHILLRSSRVERNLENRSKTKQLKVEAGRKGGLKSGESRRYKNKSEKNEAVLEANEANEAKERKRKESINTIIKDKEQGQEAAPAPPLVPGFNYLPDGRSYIEPQVFFSSADFNGLPTEKNGAIVKLLSDTKSLTMEPEKVDSLWEVFKTMELTFQKPYRNKDDVYRHFSNWVKKQSFTNVKKVSSAKGSLEAKSSIGIEFINDFSQCKMQDGSIKSLTKNESDMARYGQIKPASIKS